MLLILYGWIGVVLGHNLSILPWIKGGKGIAATSGLVISLILFLNIALCLQYLEW